MSCKVATTIPNENAVERNERKLKEEIHAAGERRNVQKRREIHLKRLALQLLYTVRATTMKDYGIDTVLQIDATLE